MLALTSKMRLFVKQGDQGFNDFGRWQFAMNWKYVSA